MGKINEFLSLKKEYIYLIIHSYHYEKKQNNINFYKYTLNFIEQIKSYNEGIKKDLNKEIKEIIESKDFFSLIHYIYNTDTIKDYCKNPVQYLKDMNKNEIKKYYEKEEEIYLRKNIISSKKELKITNFTTGKKESLNKNNKELDEDINYDILCINDILTDDKNDKEILNSNDLKEIDEKEIDCQLEMNYKYFMKNTFTENFFKERIIFSYLPVEIKGFVSNIPKIIINVCGNNILKYKYDANCDEFKLILKALLVCVVIHELIHLCRRENRDKIFQNDQYTPKIEDKIFEGGKSLIYHIFGVFVIVYINLEFAKAILDLHCWKNHGNILKEKYSKLGDDEKAQKENIELNGGIKCYNSELDDQYSYEEDDYNYYYCC